MTEIKPFAAIHYNPHKVESMSKVVCPPYDVISPAQQDGYHNQSDYNFIRILLGKDFPDDEGKANKYNRAKQTFEEWIREGILVQDDRPSIYYYRQEYKVLGERHSRLGFVSLMKIQDEQDARIFPHENTHSKAKEDRLKLWSKLSANLSPIFVCFSDKERRVEKIFTKNVMPMDPFLDVEDEDGVRHTLWRLQDEAKIAEITAALERQHLFIADGHHRYEVAKEYRRQQIAKLEKSDGKEPFNYVMTYFTNMDSKDLKIFPMHRIVKHLSEDLEFLEESFRMDRIKTKEDLAILLAKAGQNEHAFGLYSRTGIRLLRLKNKLLIDKVVQEGSQAFRSLDATILKYFVFDRMGVESEDILYTHDLNRVTDAVDSGEAQAGFVMNPVRIKQLRDIALNGERMPPKTTYFYPKVLSGLTVYKMS